MAQPTQAEFLVSPVLPQCKVWVSVDGVDTPVYSAKVEGKKVSGYIEAREGAAFSVHFRDERTLAPGVSMSASVYLDGRRARGIQVSGPDWLYITPIDHKGRLHTFSSARVNDTTDRAFMFGKLVTTDDDEQACGEEGIVKAIGTIQLKISRIKNVFLRTTSAQDRLFTDIVMHEQLKKAQLSHQTALGPSRRVKTGRASTYTSIDTDEKPYTTFEFIYRSRALLELEGKAPALTHPAAVAPPPAAVVTAAFNISTPPIASGSKSKKRPSEIVIASDDEEEELARLQARVEEIQRRKAAKGGVDNKSKIKKEVKQERKPDLMKVKQEGGSSCQGKGKMEVLELSDSD